MTKLEKRSVLDSNATRSNVVLRCGDCLHFKGTPHPSFGSRCSDLGVKSYGSAPPCYAPNVVIFNKVSPDTFAVLASLVSSFSPAQSRVLMGLLKTAGSLDKYGYSFLQKVYFRLGEDYLDNYYSGYVLGVGMEKTVSIVGKAFFKGDKRPIMATLMPESVLDTEEFKKRRKKLMASGKLYEPRKARKNDISDEYMPPTIETAQETLDEMAKRSGKKRIKNGKLKVLEVTIEKETKMPEVQDD